jgi:hypothetical protein
MCGGNDWGYSGASTTPMKPCWNKFWNELNLPSEDKGLFVEVIRGCESYSCKIQCQCRGIAKSEFSFDELHNIVTFLEQVERPQVMLYGLGDVTNYDWKEYFKKYKNTVSYSDSRMNYYRINVSPTIDKESILALAAHGVSVNFNVNTPEEAVLANLIKQDLKLRCRLGKIIVPVMRGVDYMEILKTSIFGIEFNSFTPSKSNKYISAKEFKNNLASIGIEVDPVVYKLKAGFKPVIEEMIIEDDRAYLTLRRCFQPESKGITLKMSHKEKKFGWEDSGKVIYDQLVNFAKIIPNCSDCSDIVWYYNFRR